MRPTEEQLTVIILLTDGSAAWDKVEHAMYDLGLIPKIPTRYWAPGVPETARRITEQRQQRQRALYEQAKKQAWQGKGAPASQAIATRES